MTRKKTQANLFVRKESCKDYKTALCILRGKKKKTKHLFEVLLRRKIYKNIVKFFKYQV